MTPTLATKLLGLQKALAPFRALLSAGGLSIVPNPGAWSQAASIIYLDSPAGVGLSYSETEDDYLTNDTRTAQDSNIFLRKFFAEYEGFAKLPFYLAGDRLSPTRN
jgi:serine carboxypeptidase-like clade 1